MNDGYRRLALLRHAKSDWSVDGQPDRERSLNQRGRLASALIGAWIAEQSWRLDLAMVSDAVRAQETWKRVAPMLPEKPVVWTEPQLYHAEPDDHLSVLRKAPDDAQTVLMIGHNPGLEAFAAALTPTDALDAAEVFPTAAIGVFKLRARDWARADFGDFELLEFERPKSLV